MSSRSFQCRGPRAAAAGLTAAWLFAVQPVARASDPWADRIVSYVPGANAQPGYQTPGVALGPPERFTGEGSPYPSVVSMFSGAFGPDEIVSIGEGGHLTVRFDEPIVEDPSHPFGIDLLVFGNASFIDPAWPNGRMGNPAGIFAEPAMIEISSDGVTFLPVAPLADALFPTQGWLDSGPYDPTPGRVPSNFLKPVNPALSLSSFNGLSYAEALALYDGSGGGTGVDIVQAHFGNVSYVRISVPIGAGYSAEIDAFAAVPEPGTGCCLAMIGGAALARRRTPRSRR